MTEEKKVSEKEIDLFYQRLHSEGESGGYHLNPDVNFAKDLVRGLLENQSRYGYPSCPCRLASGKKEEDVDIICPCDYRDPDLNEYDACYCALYVSSRVVKGEKSPSSIPERRPGKAEREAKAKAQPRASASLSVPVWRCKVCGYLCGRESPPEICPICKAKKERFEKFMA